MLRYWHDNSEEPLPTERPPVFAFWRREWRCGHVINAATASSFIIST
jgi:hypothetical protein